MVRANFRGHDSLSRRDDWQFIGGADVQHMKTMRVSHGEVDGSASAQHRCGHIANLGMGRNAGKVL